MLQDRVSNPGPLTYESGALPIATCKFEQMYRLFRVFRVKHNLKVPFRIIPLISTETD